MLQISIRLDDDTVDRLVEFAEFHKMSRAAATEFMVKQGVASFAKTDQLLEVETSLKEEIYLLKTSVATQIKLPDICN